MKNQFYIYHIIGRKVGCTTDLQRRKKQYLEDEGKIPIMLILEILQGKTPQEAGNIEWEWADKLGYPRGNHYSVTYESFQKARSRMTAEQRLEYSKKAGQRRIETMTPEQRLRGRRNGGRQQMKKVSSIQQQERGRVGGHKRAENATKGQLSEWSRIAASYRGQCPHCGLETNLSNLHRYHCDNCPKKPKTLLKRPSLLHCLA